jgi:hypothetical protein
MKRVLCFVFFILIPAFARAEPSLFNAKAPDFSLLDQYGRQYSLGSFAGQPLVLIASDQEGSKQNRQWVDRIQKKYKERIRIEGVADVRTVPVLMKSVVRSDFKKNKDSILLDWDGAMFTSYGCVKSVSNVILIDSKGYIRHIHAGGATADAVDRLFRKIDTLNEVRSQ